jgi:hypothetical protein
LQNSKSDTSYKKSLSIAVVGGKIFRENLNTTIDTIGPMRLCRKLRPQLIHEIDPRSRLFILFSGKLRGNFYPQNVGEIGNFPRKKITFRGKKWFENLTLKCGRNREFSANKDHFRRKKWFENLTLKCGRNREFSAKKDHFPRKKWFEKSAPGEMHCVPASLKGKYVIRFTVTSARTTIQVLCGRAIFVRIFLFENYYFFLNILTNILLKLFIPLS